MQLRKATNTQMLVNVIISFSLILNYALDDWFNGSKGNGDHAPIQITYFLQFSAYFGVAFLGVIVVTIVFMLVFHIAWNYVAVAFFEVENLHWKYSLMISALYGFTELMIKVI